MNYFEKQELMVLISTDLLEKVDALLSDEPTDRDTKRNQAIEEALQLWCDRQRQSRLERSADYHRDRHNQDETGWLV